MVQVAEMKRKFPRFAAAAIQDVQTSTLPWQTSSPAHVDQPVEQLPEAGPSRSICANLRPSAGKQLMFLKVQTATPSACNLRVAYRALFGRIRGFGKDYAIVKGPWQ